MFFSRCKQCLADGKRTMIAIVVIAVAVLGYVQFFGAGRVELKFVELPSPKGFRALILDTQTSNLNPLFGLPSTADKAEAKLKVSVCDGLLRDGSSPEIGPRDAKVTLVEFFDYRCPYCKKLSEILFELQEERNVRVIYKEWPILSEGSVVGARAALAAGLQGKYVTFHTQLMSARLLTTNGYARNMAMEHGLDAQKLLKDMYAPEMTAVLQRNAALAHELGVIGTPVLVVGRTIVQGAISKQQLGQLIEIEASSPSSSVC